MINVNVLCISGWSVNQDESVRREWLSGSPLAPHNLSILPALFFFFFSGWQTTYFFIRWFYGIPEYSGFWLVKGSILWSDILVMSATVFKWLVLRKPFPTVQKRLKYCLNVLEINILSSPRLHFIWSEKQIYYEILLQL